MQFSQRLVQTNPYAAIAPAEFAIEVKKTHMEPGWSDDTDACG
jgi:hypothetical protein